MYEQKYKGAPFFILPFHINRSDCGIFVMKNIELFSPRRSLIGLHRHTKDTHSDCKRHDVLQIQRNGRNEAGSDIVQTSSKNISKHILFMLFCLYLSLIFFWISNRAIFFLCVCRFMGNMPGRNELRRTEERKGFLGSLGCVCVYVSQYAYEKT